MVRGGAALQTDQLTGIRPLHLLRPDAHMLSRRLPQYHVLPGHTPLWVAGNVFSTSIALFSRCVFLSASSRMVGRHVSSTDKSLAPFFAILTLRAYPEQKIARRGFFGGDER